MRKRQMTSQSAKMPEVRHFFIRHGDNRGNALSECGIDEARKMHELLAEKGLAYDALKTYCADNLQSIESATLVLCPDLPLADLAQQAKKAIQGGTIKLDSRLRYTKFGKGDEQIAAEFQDAYDAGSTMRFYVNRSDEFLRANPRLSTYTTIARTMAQTLLLRDQQKTDSLNCGKQFLWPTLRAKLLETTDGPDTRDKYVGWYCDKKELKDSARLDIAVARLSLNGCVLEDDYGRFETSRQTLIEIARGETDGGY